MSWIRKSIYCCGIVDQVALQYPKIFARYIIFMCARAFPVIWFGQICFWPIFVIFFVEVWLTGSRNVYATISLLVYSGRWSSWRWRPRFRNWDLTSNFPHVFRFPPIQILTYIIVSSLLLERPPFCCNVNKALPPPPNQDLFFSKKSVHVDSNFLTNDELSESKNIPRCFSLLFVVFFCVYC